MRKCEHAFHSIPGVVVTGPSLGGALASMTAAALVHNRTVPTDKLSLYTFGMTIVGDKKYSLDHVNLVKNSFLGRLC